MRPLHHPAIDDVSIEGILYALSDPARAHIYASIAAASNPQTCSTFLEISDRQLPKSTLSLHFKVLREAGLIRSERRGVELHNSARCEELNQRFPGLMPAIVAAYRSQNARPDKARRRRARRG
ncbi:MAG: ArsR/SmtB family transcription factor [Steroidobacteraceae bacterium]